MQVVNEFDKIFIFYTIRVPAVIIFLCSVIKSSQKQG